MDDNERHQRNAERAMELNPVFAKHVAAVFRDMESEGFRPRINDAWRDPKVQLEKFRKGLSHVRWGFHCAVTPEGKPDAMAADTIDEDSPLAPRLRYEIALLWAARRNGLTTGLLFGLPEVYKRQLIEAASQKKFDFVTKRVGWDGGHLEPLFITVAQARAGIRMPS